MEKLKRGNLRADELNKQIKLKKKKQRFIILVAVAILVVFLFVIYIYNNRNKTYNSFKTVQTIELSNTTGSSYLSYKAGVLKITRDGAEAISADGKVLWNVSYNMKDPIGTVCGSYVAIADRGGTSLRIIDGSGKANEITEINTIEQIEVAAQGVTAVLTSEGEKNYISLYSFDSQEYLVNMETYAQEHGFPIDIALSEDGRKLVTSYMAIENDSIKSWITFYNFGEVGESFIQKAVGAYSFENTIVPEIKFLTNDLVCVYKDNGFELYKMPEVPSVDSIAELSGEIESIFTNESLLGFLLNGLDENGTKKLLIFNYEGKKLVDKNIQVTYNKVTMTENMLIFYSPLLYDFYDLKGNHMFSGSFIKNTNFIFKTMQSDQLLYVGDAAVDRVQLSENKED